MKNKEDKMKKIINKPENIVDEMLEGIAYAHPEYVKKLDGFHVLVRKDAPIQNQVALVSGGGSGHEPSHGGYVGEGMLTAAVAGEVFTSPTPDQVLEAIKNVDDGKGVLLIIKNYTGDVMNFEMAAEMAAMEGIEVEKVVVNDDIAVENSTYTAGRRGIAGTLFVHKIAGAAAAQGKSLKEVKNIAEKVIANIKTMGMSLDACTVPAAGKKSFELKEDEVEIGLGIHGEPGVSKEKLKTADEHTQELMDRIFKEIHIEKEEVAVLINGLGATPLMELYIVNRKVSEILKEKNIHMAQSFVGNYMTALEMPGFSITLLKLDDETKTLLQHKANTPAFKQF